MSDDPIPHIRVFKSEGYVPSERTAAALEALAVSVAADATDAAEVAGFAFQADRLAIGSELKASIIKPAPMELCLGTYAKGGDGTEVCSGVFW